MKNQIVVKLVESPTLTIDELLLDYDAVVLDTLLASSDIYLVRITDERASTLAKLESDANVEYAERNYMLETPEANPMGTWAWGEDDLTVATEAHPMGTWAWGADSDEPLSAQYAFDLIEYALPASDVSDRQVTVAVLDTGIQAAHPLLSASLVPGYDFVDDDNDPAEVMDGLDSDEDGLIDEAAGHGTHVAGIVHMVAPDAKIMPIRVLDSDGRGNLFLIAEAMQYAADSGADVINMSLGVEFKSRFLRGVVDSIIDSGVVVVAAAGNNGVSTQHFPAAYRNVIAVAAVDEQANLLDFSNYGQWVDIAAPGQSIYSAFPIDGYAWWSGTSMATPFVSGTAAVMLATTPDMTAHEVRAQMGMSNRGGPEDASENAQGNSAELIPLLNFSALVQPE